MLLDLLQAARRIRRRPGFAAVVVLTLALAIGFNSSIFGLVNAFFLRPLPIADSRELVNLYSGTDQNRFGGLSYPDYRDVRDRTDLFRGVMGYSGLMASLSGDGPAEALFGELVTPNYFAVLGIEAALGRTFTMADGEVPGANPVAVISHGLWRRRFGADSAVVGSSIVVNGSRFTVLGVAPATFRGVLFSGLSSEIWIPTAMMKAVRADQLEARGERWLFVKARLRPGVTIARVREALGGVATALASTYPATNRDRAFAVVRTDDVAVSPDGDRVALPAATLLLAAVAVVLLIACANLANLMLARGAARRREIAIRLALGASRARVVRGLVVESGLLALAGGGAGLALAWLVARGVASFHPPIPVPISLDLGVDVRVAGYTILVTAAATLLFSVLPALRSTRVEVARGLIGHRPGGGFLRRFGRIRHALLIPQVGLSLVLLVVAGLFGRSVSRARDVDPGFRVEGTAMLALQLAQSGRDEASAAGFWRDLASRARALPGVTHVALTDRIPLDLYGNQGTEVIDERGAATPFQLGRVDAGYFDALAVRIVQGRGFSPEEVEHDLPVAVVSLAGARRLWPTGENPVGRRIRQGGADQPLVEIVGVAADAKVASLGEAPTPLVYRPLGRGHERLLRFVVVSTGDPRRLAGSLRGIVAALDPAVAVIESTTLADHLAVMVFPFRLTAVLATALGLFGLVLALVGLYGVVAFAVVRRERELAIRAALGAERSRIVGMVIGDALRPAAVGILLGLLMAVAVARLLQTYLFGIGSFDPVAFGGVTIGLMAVVLLASAMPARRAGRASVQAVLRDASEG